MTLVCLDTHILIWGLKHEAEPGQEEMIARARALLESFDKDNTQVMIPSVVLAELLINIPSEQHLGFISELERKFMIIPFDSGASLKYADLWNTKKQIRNEDSTFTREHFKTDLMIVASAISRESDCIYSGDAYIQKVSIGSIECLNIPPLSGQIGLEFPK